MSNMTDMKRELDELRHELRATQAVIRAQARERVVIERYLENLTSRRYWTKWDKRLAGLLPLWSFSHPLRVLSREPFSEWAKSDLALTQSGSEARKKEADSSGLHDE